MAGLPIPAGVAKPGSVSRLRLCNIGVAIDLVSTLVTLATGVGLLFGIASLTDIGLIDRGAFTSGLSIASPLVTMVMFISPIPVVMDAVKKMNAQNLPTAVFQSQALCNILGIAYGIQIANAAVLITNLVGLGFQIVYLACDHHVKNSSGSWIFFSMKLSGLFNAGLYCFATVVPITILGHLITIFNVILFAVPLAKLGGILQSRNASSLPTAMTCISVANNAVWSLFGLMIEDFVVLFPSVLGFCLSAFQVMVIMWCKGTLPFDLGFLLLLCRMEATTSNPPKRAAGEEEE